MRHVFIPVVCSTLQHDPEHRLIPKLFTKDYLFTYHLGRLRQSRPWCRQTVDLRESDIVRETVYLSKPVIQNNNTGLMNVQHVYTPSTFFFLDLCVLPNPLVYG
jgi:hypothetical protein